MCADFSAAGSDSTISVVKSLAEAFQERTGVVIEIGGGGSSYGAKSCLNGETALGFLSRDLKPSELEKGLVGTSYAIDGVAVVVSPKNPISSVTLEELSILYSGERGWRDGRPVVLFNRNASSGTREVFQKVVMKKEAFADNARILHDKVMMRNVSRIRTAVGYTSASGVADTVKILEVAGYDPTPENLLNGNYPITRTLTFASRPDSGVEVEQFLEFVLSEEGASIIQDSGFLPLSNNT